MTAPASSTASAPPAASGTLVASGTYVQHAGGHAGEFTAQLHGAQAYPHVTGFSEYTREGSTRELHVSVAAVSGLAGRHVTVFIRGTRAGQLTISASGSAHGEWHTEHGQTVPFASAGSRVDVRVS